MDFKSSGSRMRKALSERSPQLSLPRPLPSSLFLLDFAAFCQDLYDTRYRRTIAVPIFRRMLASDQRELASARTRNEPASQIAARELEIVRISTALRRADGLDDDVAAAIESAVS